MKRIFFVFILTTAIQLVFSQDRFVSLENRLTALSVDVPALNEKVDISVNDVSIQEFVRGIANNVSLNINVDPALNIKITNNYSQVKVADILIFLCRQYELELNIYGSILSLSKYQEIIVKPKVEPKIPKVEYNPVYKLLSMDLYNDTLINVIRVIIDKTGRNVILAPGLGNQIVGGYIKDMSIDEALTRFAFSNQLKVTNEDSVYLMEKEDVMQNQRGNVQGRNDKNNKTTHVSGKNSKGKLSDDVQVINRDSININVEGAPLYDLFKQVSDELGINYFIVSQIDGNVTLQASGLSYDEFISNIVNGTSYTYYKDGSLYFVGEVKSTALQATRIVQLQYRTVDKFKDFIPDDLKKEVKIVDFPDLNSIVLSGNIIAINKLENFIREVDKVVPVILIELMIVENTKNYSITTGVSAGIGKSPSSKKVISPGIDYTFNTQTINDLINSFNGFGWFNLGNVTPDFYLSIQALESNGVLNVRSTPKLATLNGHEATMSSGETRYYSEKRSNFMGTQNPVLEGSVIYKPINADLAVTIKPFVSGDDQITLDVDVNVSEFTESTVEGAPPGSFNRKFKSIIRMKDKEMILLGGIEKTTNQSKGSGLPLLSRIPVLKWIFGSRTRSKTEIKLNLFIRPTIIY